jgi:hypothetical protein
VLARACVDVTSFSTSEARIAFGSSAIGGFPVIAPLPNSHVGLAASSLACASTKWIASFIHLP